MNQAQESSMKRPVARGMINSRRNGKAAPVTIQTQPNVNPTAAPNVMQTNSYPGVQEPLPKKKKKAPIVLLIILLVLVAAGFIGYKLFESEVSKLVDVDTVYNGIQLEGNEFGGKTKADMAVFAAEKENEKNQQILFNITLEGQEPIPIKLGDLSPKYNTDEIVDSAYNYGRDGNNIDRYITVKKLQSEPKGFFIDYSIDQSSVDEIVKRASEHFNKDMSNATVKFNPNKEKMFTVKGGKNGIKIDDSKLKADLISSIEQKSFKDIQLSSSVVEPEISEKEALANTVLMAQFSTKTTGAYNRDTNIKLAAASFNGRVVQPGEVFSINESTGKRTAAKGYKAAGAIKDGKMIQDIGGGVCQVSSTLYGAVIRAGLEIVKRQPHRWRSSYVPVGQDAAIDWPHADFKFKNNTKHPIYLRSTKVGTKLTVYIYGPPLKWDKIEVVSHSTGTLYPDSPKIIKDSSLASGVKVTETKARNGETAVAYRVYYLNGKEDHREKLPDTRHEPVRGVIRVGTGAPASNKSDSSSSQSPEKSE